MLQLFNFYVASAFVVNKTLDNLIFFFSFHFYFVFANGVEWRNVMGRRLKLIFFYSFITFTSRGMNLFCFQLFKGAWIIFIPRDSMKSNGGSTEVGQSNHGQTNFHENWLETVDVSVLPVAPFVIFKWMTAKCLPS